MERVSQNEELSLIEQCQRALGYEFRDIENLRNALTHTSGADHRLKSNERLEFLGDAILGAIVCDLLYRSFPELHEGDLTKIKSVVVSRQICTKMSRALGLDEFLIMGKGLTSRAAVPSSLMADVFESIVGAIYLDGGMEPTKTFVLRHLEPEVRRVAEGTSGVNYKSLLQQVAQREFGATPIYDLLDEKGPDHSKCFKVAAQIAGARYMAAWGRNKKEAEQHAAMNALSQLAGEPAPFPGD